jgi:hypothetical protein
MVWSSRALRGARVNQQIPITRIRGYLCSVPHEALSLKRWTSTARLPFYLLIPADE